MIETYKKQLKAALARYADVPEGEVAKFMGFAKPIDIQQDGYFIREGDRHP